MELHLFEKGNLYLKNDVVSFIDLNKQINDYPLNNIEQIYIYSNVVVESEVLSKLASKGVGVTLSDGYHNLSTRINSYKESNGKVLLNQCLNYHDTMKRLKVAKEFVKSSYFQICSVLDYYQLLGCFKYSNKIEMIEKIYQANGFYELLALEGRIRKGYYSLWNQIINNNDFRLVKRQMHPCKDRINTLISYGNAIFYPICRNYIIESKLSPEIAFLHSSNQRQTSLEYDISEIYKPIIVDRAIFSLINKKEITKEDFVTLNEGTIVIKYLAKTKLIKRINDKLSCIITIDHRKVSLKNLIYKDCVNLREYLIDSKNDLKFYRSKW